MRLVPGQSLRNCATSWPGLPVEGDVMVELLNCSAEVDLKNKILPPGITLHANDSLPKSEMRLCLCMCVCLVVCEQPL